jgi:hypothetical protein
MMEFNYVRIQDMPFFQFDPLCFKPLKFKSPDPVVSSQVCFMLSRSVGCARLPGKLFAHSTMSNHSMSHSSTSFMSLRSTPARLIVRQDQAQDALRVPNHLMICSLVGDKLSGMALFALLITFSPTRSEPCLSFTSFELPDLQANQKVER